MQIEQNMGVSSPSGPTALSSASQIEPASGLAPDGLQSTDAAHSPLPWSIHAEPVANRAAALEELTYQLDHTKELASHLYLLNADGLCPGLTGCGPTSKANAEFIARACNSYYDLLEACREALDEDCGLMCADRLRAAISKATGAA